MLLYPYACSTSRCRLLSDFSQGELSMTVYVWPVFLFAWLFYLGASIGSFLNVCIVRIPSRRSPCWPSSHCLSCFRSIATRDNLPLLSYWLLRGKCRNCGASFSMRYFWIEFATGALFTAVYVLEVGLNVHDYPTFGSARVWYLNSLVLTTWSWSFFALHALMLSFMMTAAMIEWEWARGQRSVVVAGCVLGLLISLCWAWPYPLAPVNARKQPGIGTYPTRRPPAPASHPEQQPEDDSWWSSPFEPRSGYTLWPVWGPLPAWLAPESWLLGLLTGMAGLVAGLALRRTVVYGPDRKVAAPETLGSDSLMVVSEEAGALRGWDDGGVFPIAGSFLGWQPVACAFALALLLAVLLLPWIPRSRRLAFGTIALAAVLICWLGWTWIGTPLAPLFFRAPRAAFLLVVLAGAGVVARGTAMSTKR